jgi:hypothetical protein
MRATDESDQNNTDRRNKQRAVYLLIGGRLCNSDKRWNPQNLGETLLLLLLGIDLG